MFQITGSAYVSGGDDVDVVAGLLAVAAAILIAEGEEVSHRMGGCGFRRDNEA